MEINAPLDNKRPRWWGKLTVAIFVVALPFTPLGFALHFPITNWAQGCCLGGGLLLPVLFALATFVSRATGAHSYNPRRLLNFGLLFGLSLIGLGCAAWLNGALDAHPLEEHETRVIQNDKRNGFQVKDWRAGHQGGKFRLMNPPEGIRIGDPVIMVVGPGLFGMWLDEVRPAQSR